MYYSCEKVSSQSTRARLGHYRSIAAATNGPAPKVPEHTTHPYSVPPYYATDSARARLPRDFFARLGGWLLTDPATDSVSVSIGVARRNHAASERALLPG